MENKILWWLNSPNLAWEEKQKTKNETTIPEWKFFSFIKEKNTQRKKFTFLN